MDDAGWAGSVLARTPEARTVCRIWLATVLPLTDPQHVEVLGSAAGARNWFPESPGLELGDVLPQLHEPEKSESATVNRRCSSSAACAFSAGRSRGSATASAAAMIVTSAGSSLLRRDHHPTKAGVDRELRGGVDRPG